MRYDLARRLYFVAVASLILNAVVLIVAFAALSIALDPREPRPEPVPSVTTTQSIPADPPPTTESTPPNPPPTTESTPPNPPA